jgi:hypothetical protein
MLGLPSTKRGNDCAFVVVDLFSKMAILATCKKSITVEATTKLFFERVWIHFGIPQNIILDQDSQFLKTLWSQPLVTIGHQAHQIHCLPPPNIWKNQGCQPMIVHIPCMYNSKHPRTWDESIPYVHHNYNRAIHSSIDHNPFQVGLGFQPLGPMDVALPLVATQEDSSHAQTEAEKSTRFIEQIQHICQ